MKEVAGLVHWVSGEVIYLGQTLIRIAYALRRWAESKGAQS